jgi:hypothetical protein
MSDYPIDIIILETVLVFYIPVSADVQAMCTCHDGSDTPYAAALMNYTNVTSGESAI